MTDQINRTYLVQNRLIPFPLFICITLILLFNVETLINTWPGVFTELIHIAFTHGLHMSAVVYSHLQEPNISTPVTVDDVGACLLPLGLEVFEFSIGVAPQVLVAGLEETFGRHQHHVHQNTPIVLAAVDFLEEVSEEALRDNACCAREY